MCNVEKRVGNGIMINELREKANWKGSEDEGRKALLDRI
jgi:hypothetical protein